MSEFPLLVFTVLTGLAAGGFIMNTILPKAPREKAGDWIYPAVCVALLAIGMLGVLLHLGRPERFLNALANPSAMIAQEAYWSMPFGLLLAIDALLLKLGKKDTLVKVLGSIAGGGLMVVTSIAYFTSYGVPEWTCLPTIPLFIVGDLALGASFALAYRDESDRRSLSISFALWLLTTATCIAEAVVFSAHAPQLGMFIVGAALAVIPAAVPLFQAQGRIVQQRYTWVAFAIGAVAMIIARFAFYSIA